MLTVNPWINAPGIYSYNRSESLAFIRDPAFIWDPAFIKCCCIGLLRKNLCRTLLTCTGYSNKLIILPGLSDSFIRDLAFIRDPAFNWDPAFIRTIDLDPWHLFESRRLTQTRRLSGDLRYLPPNSTYTTMTESTAHAQVLRLSAKWKIFLRSLLSKHLVQNELQVLSA